MIERFGSWLGHHISKGMAWFDAQPGGVQVAIPILVMVLVCIVLPIVAHWLGEFWADWREWCEWRQFRLWRERRRRASVLRLPRGLR